MDAASGVEMVPLPASGRIVRTERRVRLGDVSPAGRLRLDALVRYLQDVATDDSRNVELEAGTQWVVRRTEIAVEALPAYEGMIGLATWCGGIGSHFAERRTSVVAPDGSSLVQAATLWVQVDAASMRPTRVGSRFLAAYGEAAGGRTVRSRLHHHDPSPGSVAAARPWPVRFADFDALGHVNNAAAWATVEEVLSEHRDRRAPLRASVEHRRPIERGTQVRLAVEPLAAGFDIWLVDETGTPLVTAQLRCC